ncbi:hypothetical protein K488DRAFT_47046 [Vararia minispora EC-137]|uniref:Uncharacterized protein n=1 Tax=Vararia minispora EC-137 TaxID=1314806 RepID=A0ACB8QQ40_9AGAM|nr:hypothetical protein K488DRAFT_47046 [Vararia minispora EC-137]
MSGIYTTLNVSPRKKRVLSDSDDEATLTPKRLRFAPPSPPKTARTRGSSNSDQAAGPPLPDHLARLAKIQTALQHAVSHALATCALAPSADTGVVRNVLNHHSLGSSGLNVRLDMDDLRRLCWLWEWDGKTESIAKVHERKGKSQGDENPFLDDDSSDALPLPPKDWTRGAMGFVLSPTTHISKSSQSRIPAYGIGIEVEMDMDKGMGSGMAAVARWTAGGDARRKAISSKLRSWIEIHKGEPTIPNLPMADLPQLGTPAKPSNLTRLLASASPKSPSSQKILCCPPSPTSFAKKAQKSPLKSPAKRSSAALDFASALAVTSKAKASGVFPQTPSRHTHFDDPFGLLTPRTPSLSPSRSDSVAADSLPVTPVAQRGANAATVPQTPTSSRRQALYDRIRDKALSSPTKSPTKNKEIPNTRLSRIELLKLSQDEMRRRVLLGRLGSVAESIWMQIRGVTLLSSHYRLFAGSPSSSAVTARKRRTLPQTEVMSAILKSAPVPISAAEAQESIELLTSLCPFFLRRLSVGDEDWLEMPSTVGEPSSKGTPPSPGPSRNKDDSAKEVLNRSPRRVKRNEGGGLRAVRECIRKELEVTERDASF